jgi:hypothetical protein
MEERQARGCRLPGLQRKVLTLDANFPEAWPVVQGDSPSVQVAADAHPPVPDVKFGSDEGKFHG